VKHPSTEELLLLSEAEGAADQETAAHLEACAACRATLGELMGVLTAATSQLRADVGDPSAQEDAAAWARLDEFLGAQIHSESNEPIHLGADELLLSIDGDLSFEREAHLNACSACSAELLRTHDLLAEIELELRGAVADETPERRAEALATLRERLAAGRKPAEVVEFPAAARTRRTPVWQAYAAAAALGFLTFGGLYYSQVGEVAEQPTTVAQVTEAPRVESIDTEPQLEIAPKVERVAAPATATATAAPAPQPELFAALVVERKQPGVAAALDAQPLEMAASVNGPTWTPQWRTPSVPAPAARQETGASTSVRRQEPRAVALGDRVIGGVVRTALLSHYRDAARRSFQSPEPTALEGELARFVTGVYRNQSELLRHAYELNRLVADAKAGSDAKAFRKSANGHLRKVADHERAIFDGLSETLPRKFWAARTDAELPEAETTALEAQRLLDDALQLEETLTTLFNRPASSVDASLDRTPGELLDRIQTRIRRLRGSLDTL